MRHFSICSGVHADGDPYYTMTFVNGSPLGRRQASVIRGRAAKARAVLETISCIQQLAQQGAADADGPVRDPLVDR
jgi:hypothetical protein